MHELSNKYTLTGVDPSPSCVSHVSKMGIECFNGSLFHQDALPLDKKYDCIVLTHVLEHVYDLDTAIAALTSRLNPEGLLYIEVPDASRYADYYIVPFHFFDIEHINHFDENSLLNLFRKSGYGAVSVVKKVIQVSRENLYPAVGLLLQISTRDSMKLPKIIFNDSVCKSVKAYLAMSYEKDHHVEIDALAKSKEPVIIWGAGSYTLRLLETTSLGKCIISAFIDSDKSKLGQNIYGIPIVSPDILVSTPPPVCSIVVCAALYSNDIVQQIHSMNIKNRVVIA